MKAQVTEWRKMLEIICLEVVSWVFADLSQLHGKYNLNNQIRKQKETFYQEE